MPTTLSKTLPKTLPKTLSMIWTSDAASADAPRGSAKEAVGTRTGNDRVEADGRPRTRAASPPRVDEPEADEPYGG